MIEEHFFNSQEEMNASLIERYVPYLKSCIEDVGSASLMVSGGSTPEKFYQALSESDIDWSNVTIALVDERWVEASHEKSNERFVSKYLLINRAIDTNFIGMKNAETNVFNGVDRCEINYRKIQRPFSLTILGMGNDGHTASLFPEASGLSKALALDGEVLCSAINAKQSDITGKYTDRMSLTLFGLLQSEEILLLLTGEEKLKTLRKAQEPGPVELMPIRSILQQADVPVKIFWAP